MPSRPRLDRAAAIAETVVAEMVLASHAANLPQGFADGIRLERVSGTRYVITNVWERDGVPLAKFFEHGTRDHWVEPRDPDGVLAWESAGPESGRKKAIYSKRADSAKGKAVFSRGHYVSGIPATNAMHNGFRLGIERLRGELGA